MEKDVTRRAAEKASKSIFRARKLLRTIITTGPKTVRLSPAELQSQVAGGNTRLLRYAMEQMDDDVLLKLMAGSLAERGRNGTTS